MIPERLQSFTKPTPILDHGYVMLVDLMGDEDAIVQAARVSYAAGPKKGKDDRNLLRYLMRARHTSPFEQACIKLEVKLPIYVERQWARHRTASWNEVSGRYSVLPDECQKTDPAAWRLQATDNKQGSSGFVNTWVEGFDQSQLQGGNYPEGAWKGQNFYTSPGAYLSEKEAELQEHAREVYEESLKFGVAKEQARCVLPVATYTSKVWTIDLHNLLHFLALRLDPHAQKEIRDYANAIAQIVKVWVPNVWEAFEDYRLQAMTLTRQEVQALTILLQAAFPEGIVTGELSQAALQASGLDPKGREASELQMKLLRLMRG